MSNSLLELLRKGESGAAGYNAYNRGTYIGSDGKHHVRVADQDIDFSKLTLAGVQELQHLGRRDPDKLFAVGRYQVIPDTMDDAVRVLGLDPSQQFTPELQDRIFSEFLIVGKRPAVHDYVVGKKGADIRAAQRGLALEWASFGDPDNAGRSHYGGANRASITLAQSGAALNQMRVDYRASINKGITPTVAWKVVTLPNVLQAQSAPSELQAARLTQILRKDDFADGLLHQGERGEEVRGLQHALNLLGIRDARGRALAEDAELGRHTKEAVEAFQRANGLAVDGVAGPDTLGRIDQRLARGQVTVEVTYAEAPTMADSGHLGHALYRQAYRQIKEKTPQKFGLANEHEVRNAAGTLAFEAKVSGMQRIDHVIANADATGLLAVQGALSDPAHHRIYVDRAQAATQSVERSSELLRQEGGSQVRQQAEAQVLSQQSELVRTALMH